MMDSKQFILVLESKSDKDSDYMYVRSFVKEYIKDCKNIKITSIPMSGKNNYNSKSLQNKINKAIKDYKHGNSVVIYGYDTDNINSNYDDVEYDKQITDYCKRHNYQLVFFCRDVEEVFLGKRINNNYKAQEAERYLRNRGIEAINVDKLQSVNKIKGRSNLCLVLNQILNNIVN